MALRSTKIDLDVHAFDKLRGFTVVVSSVTKDSGGVRKAVIISVNLMPQLPPQLLPQLRDYYSPACNPLALELSLRDRIQSDEAFGAVRNFWESTEKWAGAIEQPPRFLESQAGAARRVAAIRSDADIGLSFLDNARLVLIGNKETLQDICVAARRAAVEAGGVFERDGILKRESAADILEGDVFHFVAAVPISTLAAFVNAVKNNQDIRGAAAQMHKMIGLSGVELDTQLHIRLHWGAFPGARGEPQVQRLRDDGVVALNALTTYQGFHVIIGGFYDPKDNKGRDCPSYEITLPGGKRDLGESGLDCCLRETFEETLLRLHTNYDHEYPEGPGIEITGVEFNYDYGPYHIVASVPDANGSYPRFCESGGGSKGGRGGRSTGGPGGGRKGGRGGRSKGGRGGGRKGGRGRGTH